MSSSTLAKQAVDLDLFSGLRVMARDESLVINRVKVVAADDLRRVAR